MNDDVITVNEANIQRFRTIGNTDKKYRCVLCNQVTCIDNSFSNRGDRLICSWCFKSKFRSAEKAFNWIRRED